MKKILALLTALTMMLSFTACGEKTEEETTTTAPDSPSYSQTPEANIPEEITKNVIPENTDVDSSDVSAETKIYQAKQQPLFRLRQTPLNGQRKKSLISIKMRRQNQIPPQNQVRLWCSINS